MDDLRRGVGSGHAARATELRMKTSLDHLPARKQDVLRAVTDALRAGAPLEMLILFGSHARGDWVEDPEGGYFSDYDLLAVVESRKVAEDVALWSRLESEARELSGEALVSLIAHDVKFVNTEIRTGSYFFGDIRNEGIVLHDARRYTLATPKEASPAERVERAERNFAYWFESANDFLEDVRVRGGGRAQQQGGRSSSTRRRSGSTRRRAWCSPGTSGRRTT